MSLCPGIECILIYLLSLLSLNLGRCRPIPKPDVGRLKVLTVKMSVIAFGFKLTLLLCNRGVTFGRKVVDVVLAFETEPLTV